MNSSRPNWILSTAVVTLLAALWCWARLFLFADNILPLTFVLPLMVCVWTRRRWQIWAMAAVFSLSAFVKVFVVLPEFGLDTQGQAIFLVATLLNVLIGAVVAQAILGMRERLESHNATISAQNRELEAFAEELNQQNEEIKAQSEELAEQNEELEAQSEEVSRQNEDLLELNARLSGREEILGGLLESFQHQQSVPEMLQALCSRALRTLGAPASAVVVLEHESDSRLQLLAHADSSEAGVPPVPSSWPINGSIAEVVLREGKTAYVSDLRQRPDLAQPFHPEGTVRSILATPLSSERIAAGLLAVCSPSASHWTEEQFRVIEWVAAQARLMLETYHSRRTLQKHATDLESASLAKDKFLAMLSHELRTPITPVLAAASTLADDPRLPADVREDLRMIRRNTGVQSKLIDDLLDLTRVNSGKIDLDHQAQPAPTLIEDSVRIVAGDLEARSQTLQIEITDLARAAIVGDGPRLQQVIWNLLKNASKFSPAGSSIQLRGRMQGERALLEIADPGEGIDDVDLERIFLPFEQTRTSPRPVEEGGLGLGLAITRSIVEAHGGSISVRSEGRGHGSTFTVELPATPLMATTVIEPPSGATVSENRSEPTCARILLIEDHADTGRIFKRLLECAGFEVEHAQTAAEAWQLFQENHYDLVVSDLGLPDESGIDLMRRISASRPGTPAICLSGYGMEDDIAACREAGFQEHLTKPIEFNRLHAAITRALACSENVKTA